jgi:putative nucleotidyltransferase with HDIG domain
LRLSHRIACHPPISGKPRSARGPARDRIIQGNGSSSDEKDSRIKPSRPIKKSLKELNFLTLPFDNISMHAERLREELLEKAEAVKVLPTLSSIIGELFRVMNDPNSSFKQLFDVVRYDQAISSKIIAIANSAYYSRGNSVGTLERAMIVVGFEEIKNITMCLAFLNEILHQWKLTREDLQNLWSHSVSVSYCARTLADKTMIEEPEKAFTVAILHDLGKALFYSYGDTYRRLILEAAKAEKDICMFEKETFGIDHQEVGYYIATKWRFPEEFVAIIKKHHRAPEGLNSLLDLIKIADRFINNPKADLGPGGMILSKDIEKITNETKRISTLLGVA